MLYFKKKIEIKNSEKLSDFSTFSVLNGLLSTDFTLLMHCVWQGGQNRGVCWNHRRFYHCKEA